MADYLLPDPGEGLTEAEIVSWRVKEGDTVEINDVVVEIETAKSLVELPSPYAGTVLALLVAEGETVAVGTPIISIGDPAAAGSGGTGPAPQSESDPYLGMAQRAGGSSSSVETTDTTALQIDLSNPAASGGGEGESLVGRNKADRGPVRRPRRGSASPSSDAGAATQMQLQGAFAPGGAQSDPVVEGDEPAVPAHEAPLPQTPTAFVPAAARTGERVRVLAKPPVRKLARDLGVDLTSLRGSGPDGVVTREDVQAAGDGRTGARAGDGGRGAARSGPDSATTGGAVSPSGTSPGGPELGRPGVSPTAGAREVREPIKGVRKMMGQAMVDSAFSAPHVTEWVTVDMTRTMELVERLRARRELRDVRLSPLLVVAKACLLAMRRVPEINSFWDEAAQEVVFKGYVNLGIAAATPRGLVVPNVKDADALGLAELAGAINALAATAREGRTPPADMAGGTFTITNVGVFGVDAGTPIINPGESAILCFGAIRKQPWVVTRDGVDTIEVRQVTQLALSFDHRHVDGEKGSRFLADVAAILEDPATALLF
ncbi:MAG: catalytic protein of component of various dehydrogenase complexe [Marmoricola sp.]|nr:catalytic protein of component of various dehydrogenase complexe [Marmoricola sp.]